MTQDGRNLQLASLRPYVPDEPTGVLHRLDANEAPAWSSPTIRRLTLEAVEQLSLERYPDPRALRLKAAISKWSGASAERLVVGTGSDELISLLFRAWNRPPEGMFRPVVVMPTPTFVMYRMQAIVHGWEVVEVPTNERFETDVPALLDACRLRRPNLVFLATPNNPTGRCLSPADLESISYASPWGLVVVDEAYAPFSKAPRLASLAMPNLVRMETLSKVGLAALRIGWLEAHERVTSALDVVRAPFNTSAIGQAIASVLLERAADEIRHHCAKVVAERTRVFAELTRIGHARVHPSEANFLWVEPERPADEVRQALAHRGIVVRGFPGQPGAVSRGLRISIGSADANRALVDAWSSAVHQAA